jgi:hypothetical protein
MGREELEIIGKGVVKRRVKRVVALFIDATGLDRATRRMERKVDLSRLVTGLTQGIEIEVSRYYALIPHEDDSRQLSYLEAVQRAGVEVITKRLPPKGVKRQVSIDVQIATDLLGFSYGEFSKSNSQIFTANSSSGSIITPPNSGELKRVAIVVCPSRELNYALNAAYKHGTETVLADFGLYGQTDGWKGVDRWIDLSTSETIWRD